MGRRGKTLGRRVMERLAAQEKRHGAQPPPTHDRPRVRGECRGMPRPCPFVGCRYHLFLDVNYNGGLFFPYGEDPAAIADMPETCALDRAEQGKTKSEDIAKMFRMTAARMRMVKQSALARMGLHSGIVEYSPRGRPPAFDAATYVPDYHFPPLHQDIVRRREGARLFAEATLGD